jgi:hypothetical protein
MKYSVLQKCGSIILESAVVQAIESEVQRCAQEKPYTKTLAVLPSVLYRVGSW